MNNTTQDVYLYLRRVISHGSIFWPIHCDFCELVDLEFCEYMREMEEDEN